MLVSHRHQHYESPTVYTSHITLIIWGSHGPFVQRVWGFYRNFNRVRLEIKMNRFHIWIFVNRNFISFILDVTSKSLIKFLLTVKFTFKVQSKTPLSPSIDQKVVKLCVPVYSLSDKKYSTIFFLKHENHN